MHSVVIADTSCFILLDNIGELDLLRALYSQIITTPIVVDEFGKKLPEWILVAAPDKVHLKKLSVYPIDDGEMTAIALAMDYADSVLIIDDLKARRVAEKFGLLVKGTIGVIVEAKLRGHISSIKPILEKINKTNFRITSAVYQNALKEAGE